MAKTQGRKEKEKKKGNTTMNLRKILAYMYYMTPTSPTFMNALGSLTRAGYSYNYAKSYSTKVFDMPGFTEDLAIAFGLIKTSKKQEGRGKEGLRGGGKR